MAETIGKNTSGREVRFSLIFFAKLTFFLLAAAEVVCLQWDRIDHASHKPRYFSVPSGTIEHSVLGQRMLAADLIWIRWIQDVDYKENEKEVKGWSFRMLDAVTTLDPRYRIAYLNGGTLLSTISEDVEGARIIFERGVANFPHDWVVLYRAGYHMLYEVGDCKRAAYLFNEARIYGAPTWLSSLSAALYTKAGEFQLARAVLQDALKRFEGSPFIARIKQRLGELDRAEKTLAAFGGTPPIGRCGAEFKKQ